MHSRIKENRARLQDEYKPGVTDNRSRLDPLPKNRKSFNDNSMSRIVLPKIHDKNIHKFEPNSNLSNISSMSKHQLPNLANIAKNSLEIPQKERYIKYKSLLQRQKVDTDRDYNRHQESGVRLQSSSSSQNMSVQEMILDKVYGTLDREANCYL